MNRMVYFCSQDGECNLTDVPDEQTRALEDMLNDRGSDGWELVQLIARQGGLVAFWKRKVRN
jgi:hypothetical protein